MHIYFLAFRHLMQSAFGRNHSGMINHCLQSTDLFAPGRFLQEQQIHPSLWSAVIKLGFRSRGEIAAAVVWPPQGFGIALAFEDLQVEIRELLPVSSKILEYSV